MPALRTSSTRPTSTVAVSGHIEAWPAGFLSALPTQHWTAILAPPRQDKLLVSALRQRDIHGLMLYERRLHRYPGKGSAEHLVPLLGAWAFVHDCSPEQAWATGRVVRMLQVRQEAEFVRDLNDMITLLQACAASPVVRPELVVGTRVRIAAGTLAGLYGVVVRRRGHARLVVNLVALGTSVSVELPAESAESAEPVSS